MTATVTVSGTCAYPPCGQDFTREAPEGTTHCSPHCSRQDAFRRRHTNKAHREREAARRAALAVDAEDRTDRDRASGYDLGGRA